MDNFLSESRAIIQAGGGFMVKDRQELIDTMKSLISGEDKRQESGRKAYEAVQLQKGAVSKTEDLLKNIINTHEKGN